MFPFLSRSFHSQSSLLYLPFHFFFFCFICAYFCISGLRSAWHQEKSTLKVWDISVLSVSFQHTKALCILGTSLPTSKRNWTTIHLGRDVYLISLCRALKGKLFSHKTQLHKWINKEGIISRLDYMFSLLIPWEIRMGGELKKTSKCSGIQLKQKQNRLETSLKLTFCLPLQVICWVQFTIRF